MTKYVLQQHAVENHTGEDAQAITANAKHTSDQSHMPGGRNEADKTKSHLVVFPRHKIAIIAKTATVQINGGVAADTYLGGLYVHTALTGTCVITGLVDSDGAAQTYTLPAGTVGYVQLQGENTAGALTMTCANAGDNAKVAVMWFDIS